MSKDISEERVWLEMLTSVKRFTHNLGFKTFLNQHLFGRTSFEKIPLSKMLEGWGRGEMVLVRML